MREHGTVSSRRAEKDVFNKRLEDIGWGLLLVMTGGIWLVPHVPAPLGIWLTGTGLILLGINAVRYFRGIRLNRFTVALGALALAAGLEEFFSLDLPILALGLVLFGAIVLFGARRTPTKKSGDAGI